MIKATTSERKKGKTKVARGVILKYCQAVLISLNLLLLNDERLASAKLENTNILQVGVAQVYQQSLAQKFLPYMFL